MPRTARPALEGMIFHVLNRGTARDPIFDDEADSVAFEKVMAETQTQFPVRIVCDRRMPYHWHPGTIPQSNR